MVLRTTRFIALSCVMAALLPEAHAGTDLEALTERLRLVEQRLGIAPTIVAPDTEEALAEFSQRLALVESRLEQQQASAQATLPAPLLSVTERGAAARSADGDFEIRVRAGMHADHRNFLGEQAGTPADGFLFRRIRPTLEGKLGPLVSFRITPELAGDNASLIDAWMDLKLSPLATLRVGKLKGPVGLERLQPLSTLALMERGFPTELAPNRDLGVQLMGELARARLSYQIGLFNGTPDGRNSAASDADGNPELNARVFAHPWRGTQHALAGLGFGLAISEGRKEGAGNAFLPRYRSPGQQVFFAYRNGVAAEGSHRRISPQAYYYAGPFSLQAEHIRSRQQLTEPGDPAQRRQFQHSAWQLTAGWVVTGEGASYGSVVKPSIPFEFGGGWGALELVARYGVLDTDDRAFPAFADPDRAASLARALGLGLNWYLTSNLKLVLNHTHAHFEGGAANGADRPDERSIFSRIQVAF